MKRFQSISENLSYNDILQLDGAFSALHINYGKSPLFNGENSKDLFGNYICLFNYLFISSQMSAKPYFIGSTGILLLW